jgi:hypothetical protein
MRAMNFEPGELVERRYGHGTARVGRITGRVREGYDTWYVTGDEGMTYCDNGRDLRRVDLVAVIDEADPGATVA